MKSLLLFIAASVVALPVAEPRTASVTGLWNATVTVNGFDVPFRFEIAESAGGLQGSFFNGDEKVTSTHAQVKDGSARFEFPEYGATLDAVFDGERLEGRYDRGSRGFYPFRAVRFVPAAARAGNVPSIAGMWNVQVRSSKGEAAWRLIVRQSGPEVSASMLRIDGDTGTLTGSYRDGAFTLSHFSGARPSLFEVTRQPDGTLRIVQKALAPPKPDQKPPSQPVTAIENGQMTLVAVRADDARAESLPQPSDPSRFTSVKDPVEPLRFSFPDLQGRIVSNADPRFGGKVVIVAIGGSWCPNCHDEAPFLSELYRKYHERGLEIVSLTFEEPEQAPAYPRLRAFIDRYRIAYPVLLAGKPDDLAETLPQAVNLNSFPTTFFIGRDGLVRGAHAGFPSRASGHFHTEATAEIARQVEQLLAEPTRSTVQR